LIRCTLPLALTFLTKLPWPWKVEATGPDLARSLFWFPWVGALLGLIFWEAGVVLLTVMPAPAAAALLLTLTVWLTGGLHLDGLADTIDGLGGGRNPEERLRIMKDSRVGTFGVAALILVLVLKFAFFLAVAQRGQAGWSIFLFPVLSRWGMVFLAYLSSYARPEGGLGQAMTRGITFQIMAGATISALALCLAVAGLRGLALLAGAALVVGCMSAYFRKHLGGITGDVLGAANEILEVLVLGGAFLFG
jgi:adenosylcobinamide-GDP ribazoletransferase